MSSVVDHKERPARRGAGEVGAARFEAQPASTAKGGESKDSPPFKPAGPARAGPASLLWSSGETHL
jgi:hypothetical protein